MVNDYALKILKLYGFILENAPPGADRDLARMSYEVDGGKPSNWLSLDFRPTNDTGCNLYVRLEALEGRFSRGRVYDKQGNEWSAYKVCCEVSWASWGAADLDTCQRRLDVMNATLAFAKAIEAAFPDVFYSLDATATEVQLREAAMALAHARSQVTDFVRLNWTGMKVGQEKIVPVPGADYQAACPVEVEREEGGRRFKYRATATSRDGFSFVRVA